MPEDIRSDPIYKALLALGRRAKLDAVAITNYPALVGCEEVQRRIDPDATELERAECAETIIRDFIATSVSVGQATEIVEAALGISEGSEGKSVATRHNDLHVSNTTFNSVRREWFELLTELLHRFPSRRRTPVTVEADRSSDFGDLVMAPDLSKKQHILLTYSFDSLGRDALGLHLAAIACLMEHELSESGLLVPTGSFACQKLLFDCLRDFQETGRYWCEVIPGEVRGLVYREPDPERVDELVTAALDEIDTCWPLTQAPYNERRAFISVLEEVIEQGGLLNRRDLYYDVWLPWYWDGQLSSIETFSRSSGAVAAVVRTASGLDHDCFDWALSEARQALKARFGKWHDRTVDGERLTDYARRFFFSHLDDRLKQSLEHAWRPT